MKEVKNIASLTEKYWAGATTLKEEQILRDHYSSKRDISSPESALFSFMKQEQTVTYSKTVQMPQASKNRWTMRLLSIAAVGLVLMVSWFGMNQMNKANNEVVIDDPELAMEITKEAFALLNGKMGKSKAVIRENIAHLDKTFIFKN